MDIQYNFYFLFSDVNNNGYFLLNSSFKQLSSLVGLRFSIQSPHIRIELQSITQTPIQIRYKTRLSSNENPKCCK